MTVPVKDVSNRSRLAMALGVIITNEDGDVVLETIVEKGKLVDEIRTDDD